MKCPLVFTLEVISLTSRSSSWFIKFLIKNFVMIAFDWISKGGSEHKTSSLANEGLHDAPVATFKMLYQRSWNWFSTLSAQTGAQ